MIISDKRAVMLQNKTNIHKAVVNLRIPLTEEVTRLEEELYKELDDGIPIDEKSIERAIRNKVHQMIVNTYKTA